MLSNQGVNHKPPGEGKVTKAMHGTGATLDVDTHRHDISVVRTCINVEKASSTGDRANCRPGTLSWNMPPCEQTKGAPAQGSPAKV
jgi:hypothetical protein